MNKKKPYKNRSSRIAFCEWSIESFGHFNTGGIICEDCNFSRSLMRGESTGTYEANNQISKEDNCPKCNGNNWYWLPPIARVPRLNANKSKWKAFWTKLKNRDFNHPDSCR